MDLSFDDFVSNGISQEDPLGWVCPVCGAGVSPYEGYCCHPGLLRISESGCGSRDDQKCDMSRFDIKLT
jgi:hypothetical protein